MFAAPRFGSPVTPVATALGPKAKGKPTILLSHTPGRPTAREAIAAGADLVVSGHTHGGQIWPFSLLIRAIYEHPHGLYEVDGGRQLTTCGIGFWGPPMRLGAPPEIWVITLAGAEDGGAAPR